MKNIITKFIFFNIFLIVLYKNTFSNSLNISLIYAHFDEKDFVVKLSWEPVDNPKAIYKIYRLKEQPKNLTIYIPKKEELVSTLDYNRTSFIDRPKEKGFYYYFVTVLLDDQENFKVVYDQNYTGVPVLYYPMPPLVDEIKAKFVPQGSKVFLTWKLDLSNKDVKYLKLYRSQLPITRENIYSLDPIIIDKERDFYIDTPKTGSYYYAITTVSVDNLETLFFYPGKNYIEKPIFVANYKGLLPEFFINFPFINRVDYDVKLNLFEIPKNIDMLDVGIIRYYIEPPKDEDKLIKDKIKIVNLELEVLALKKDWKKFLEKIELFENDPSLASIKNKLLLYKAYGLVNLGREDEAFLIIKVLQTDNDFVRLNSKKIEQIMKKIEKKRKNN